MLHRLCHSPRAHRAEYAAALAWCIAPALSPMALAQDDGATISICTWFEAHGLSLSCADAFLSSVRSGDALSRSLNGFHFAIDAQELVSGDDAASFSFDFDADSDAPSFHCCLTDFKLFDGAIESGVESLYLLAKRQIRRAGEANEPERDSISLLSDAWADDSFRNAMQLPPLFSSAFLVQDETAGALPFRFSLTPFVHLTPGARRTGFAPAKTRAEGAVAGVLEIEIDF